MLFAAILANITVSAICWAYIFTSRNRQSIFSPLVWYASFHTFIFLIRPIICDWQGYYTAYDYMLLRPDDELKATTHLTVAVALVVFAITHESFFLSRGLELSAKAMSVLNAKIPGKGILLAWALLGSVAIYSAAFVGSTVFGSTSIEMDRINGVAVNVNQNGYLLDAQFMLVGLCALLALKFRFHFISLLPTLAFFTYRSVMGWGRWSIVLCALALMLLWIRENSLRWPPKKAIFYAAPLGYLFFKLGQNREFVRDLLLNSDTSVASTDDRSSNGFLENALNGLDFANFEYLAYIIKFIPETSGTYTFGTQHLQVFTEPIPRALWPGKPVGPPIQLVNLSDFGNFVGLTTSVVGDGWLTFGYLGVIITMAILGACLGTLYKGFLQTRSGSLYSVAYTCFMALQIQIYRDGSLVSIVKVTMLVLIPVIFASYAGRSASGFDASTPTIGHEGNV